ncbi:KUP/HAK/KT family potassium transporter [Sediminibacterium sp.]|uniref:KUP/HAK/KT family potassium transporter n=1 Tax=Sediminibacterium sp. TaxID=1917865 RepID=UPI002732D768|nr:KUP/HAK/KT family potassium transporter [Sediminibacterium sp.]MDP3567530.1 KUP/HAK/KT family potassium transporter [Sediminibacterium sp.]
MSNHHIGHTSKITAAGLLLTLGIIYGDIGTSPLYVMSAIVGSRAINADIIIGGMSLVFWTLTMQTTIKYVIFTLKADNKGEGGIFSLYTLVKKAKRKWLIFPAIIGGCCILGEGIITPPISVASAVEGLRLVPRFSNIPTIPIVIAIITGLFFIQQFGTKFVGKFFGPVMLIWFSMLGLVGIIGLSQNLTVLKALNPYYGINLLINTPGAFWLLGSVFLCTTGAEALYSDMGHCGRKNIRVSWVFVKLMLVINYMGQTAWLISNDGKLLNGRNPFYSIMPEWFLPVGIGIATVATVVASQALISGSFTLINEAMRLNFWPKVGIKYPSDEKGQMYIPSVNWLLYVGCVAIVLFFKEAKNMEAAYGLTIILGMIMSSRLLAFFMKIKKYPKWFLLLFISVYIVIEGAFLIALLEKFPKGGYITLIIALLLAGIMACWYIAKLIRKRYTDLVPLDNYKQMLCDLSRDPSIQKYATHLVYMTSANDPLTIEAKVIYSILQKRPKKADIYWFVHVDVMDEPYRMDYKVMHIAKDDIIRVDFKLGFKVAPKVNLMFRKVVEDLVKNKEVDITSRYESLNKNNIIGDFKFVVLEKFLSYENDLPLFEKIILTIYFFLKRYSLSEAKAFGLDSSSVKVEKFPMVISPQKDIHLRRIE